EFAGWRGSHYRVTLDRITAEPGGAVRLRIRPDNAEKFREVLGLGGEGDGGESGNEAGGDPERTFALDKPHTDPLTERLLGTLAWLRASSGPDAEATSPQAVRLAGLL